MQSNNTITPPENAMMPIALILILTLATRDFKLNNGRFECNPDQQSWFYHERFRTLFRLQIREGLLLVSCIGISRVRCVQCHVFGYRGGSQSGGEGSSPGVNPAHQEREETTPTKQGKQKVTSLQSDVFQTDLFGNISQNMQTVFLFYKCHFVEFSRS